MSENDTKHKQMHSQRELRQEQHTRRLGIRNPVCCHCGEKELAALTGSTSSILCYECQLQARNKSTIENHHFAGHHNDSLTVPVPGNDHRILSDEQRDWPKDTLRNLNGSPLRKAAASLRGFLDILKLLIERILGWIPPFLEWLDELLLTLLGDGWWIAHGWRGELS